MRSTYLKPLAIAVSVGLAVVGCGQQPASQDATAPTAAASAPVAAAPAAAAASVFDVNELDTAVNACQDFNAFVNAKWVKANPIPADQTRWGAFDELREKSLNEQ
ncbi:MAG TPA: peptidase, partial [Rhodanobacteraceae bacterium]|nr:peptidase [Rhodanobacteraceae bacterium]